MPARISASISSAAIGIPALLALGLHQLPARLDRAVLERLADPGVVDLHSGRSQVAEQFADDVLVAGFLEIGADDVLGVAFRLGLGEAHQPRRPVAEQPVAPRDDAELHFLVAGIASLERALAIVESGHGAPLLCLSPEI